MSTDVRRIGDLEIDQDLKFQKRLWNIQRIGWALFALIILAGLLGLLGPGPMSHRLVADANGLMTVEFHNLIHYQSPAGLKVKIKPQAIHDGVLRIWLSKEFYERADIEHVTPVPLSVELAADRHIYTFKTAPEQDSYEICLEMKPEEPGFLKGAIGVAESRVETSQFVFP